jgi:hypothetical protein
MANDSITNVLIWRLLSPYGEIKRPNRDHLQNRIDNYSDLTEKSEVGMAFV